MLKIQILVQLRDGHLIKNVENSLEIIQSVFARDETYAITLNGQIIGCVALLIHPDGNYYWGDNNAELGYWIAEDFWGK